MISCTLTIPLCHGGLDLRPARPPRKDPVVIWKRHAQHPATTRPYRREPQREEGLTALPTILTAASKVCASNTKHKKAVQTPGPWDDSRGSFLQTRVTGTGPEKPKRRMDKQLRCPTCRLKKCLQQHALVAGKLSISHYGASGSGGKALPSTLVACIVGLLPPQLFFCLQ